MTKKTGMETILLKRSDLGGKMTIQKLIMVFVAFLGMNGVLFGAELAEQIAELGNQPGEIAVTTIRSVAHDVTVPANITLRIAQGGRLDIAKGKTLTLNGGFMLCDAPMAIIRAIRH